MKKGLLSVSHPHGVSNKLKCKFFGQNTNLLFKKSATYFAAVVRPSSGRSQEYKNKEITQLQYWPEISDLTRCYIKYIKYILCISRRMSSWGVIHVKCTLCILYKIL
jgi:hypothetical protein